MSSSYIGVFDSGVGGLSVLKELIKTHPHESFIYLGDTARLPYGKKSRKTILSYVQRNLNYLSSNYQLKTIVVACNSASSVLSDVNFHIPTIGVIEAGVKNALEVTKNNRIALWATQATVNSNEYLNNLLKLSTSIKLTSIACPTLVSLVEEELSSHPLLPEAFDYYLEKVPSDVDTLILGCTHFPLFKNNLKKHIEEKGLSLKLSDASSRIAQEINSSINLTQSPKKQVKILLTDNTEQLKSFVTKIMPENWSHQISLVDL